MTTSVAFSPTGLYLAFDTSGPVGSVTVARGSDPLAGVLLERRAEHASRLVPAVDAALEEAGVERSELDGIIVGEGPGSFTGVRVASATAKGLSHALDTPVWALSSLAASALAVSAGPIRYVLFDARADRVYGACYGVGRAGVQTLVAPHAGELRDVLDGEVPGGATFVGDAAERHRAAIVGAGYAVGEDVPSPSLSHGLLAYLGLSPQEPPVADVAAWEPRYLRPSRAAPLWTA